MARSVLASILVLLAGGPACSHDRRPAIGGISGAVVLTGAAPLAGIVVSLSGAAPAVTATDSSGSYAFGALPPGDYVVVASVPSTAESTRQVAVHVDAGGSVRVDLVFTPVGTIQGTVTVAGQPPGAAGVVVWLEGSTLAAVTDAAGAWSIPAVPAGAYTVAAVLAGQLTARAAMQQVGHGTITTAPDLDLIPSEPGRPDTGRLSGLASTLGLGRRPGITVSVDGTALQNVTDDSGAWTIDGVASGRRSLTLTDGVRTEHVPDVLSLPGGQGYLLDGALYPIGEIELQGGQRIAGDVHGERRLTSDGWVLVRDGTDLLSVPAEGGPIRVLARDVARFQLPPTTAPGTPVWVAVHASTQELSAVLAAGGPAVPITRAWWHAFDPTGGVLVAGALDGTLWYAALGRGDVRPVGRAWGQWGDLGPAHFQFSDPSTRELGVVEYDTGDVSWLATGTTLGSLLPGGTRVLARGEGLYGSVLVGPPSGPLAVVAPASATLLVMGSTHSPDGRWIVVETFDIGASPARTGLLLASTESGAVIATWPGSLPQAWSSDSSHFLWSTTGSGSFMLGSSVDGSSIALPASRASPPMFSPDGALVACSDGTRVRILATATGAIVAELPPEAGAVEPLAFSPDGAFLLVEGTSLVSVPTDGTGPVTLTTTYLGRTAQVTTDGQRVVFMSADGLSSAPLSGAPVTPLLGPGQAWGGAALLAPTNTVLVTSSSGLWFIPIDGGPPQPLGAVPPFDPGVQTSPDGHAIAHLDQDGVLRSAFLPGGVAAVAATGVQSYALYDGGVAATDATGAFWVGPPGGEATLVSSAVLGWGQAPGGRVVFTDGDLNLRAASLATGETWLLASGLEEPFWAGGMLRGELALFAAGGVLQSRPLSGGLATPHVRLEPGGTFEWLDDHHAIAARTAAPPPYRFQNGLYLLAIP
jgi:WD40 repeat protein